MQTDFFSALILTPFIFFAHIFTVIQTNKKWLFDLWFLRFFSCFVSLNSIIFAFFVSLIIKTQVKCMNRDTQNRKSYDWVIYYIYHCIGVWNGNEWKRWNHFVELIKKNLIKWNWLFYSAKRWQTLLWTTMKLDSWIGLRVDCPEKSGLLMVISKLI